MIRDRDVFDPRVHTRDYEEPVHCHARPSQHPDAASGRGAFPAAERPSPLDVYLGTVPGTAEARAALAAWGGRADGCVED